jgi:hypothetical protein
MKNWLEKNYKTLIIAAFLVPIITVAIVSISHVTKWYGISNPVSWSIYLSIGIEIAALSALAAISANMGKKVYFPFAIVTIVQFIGNIYFAYSYIDIDGQPFKDWVGLVSPFVEFMGVDPNDFVGHKRFLAFFAGGMLPIISLSFLHMLVKFTEEDRLKETLVKQSETPVINSEDIIGEVSRIRLSEEDLAILEKHLLNPEGPNEKLKEAAQRYSDEVREKHTHIDDFNETSVKSELTQEERGEILAEMMKNDQELGLYDEPFDNPLIKPETTSTLNVPEMTLTTNQEIIESIPSDDEFTDWDVTLMDGLEDEEPFFTEEEIEEILHEEPTEEEIDENFSTIVPEIENNFQEEVSEEEVEPSLPDDGTYPEPFATPEEIENYQIEQDIQEVSEVPVVNEETFGDNFDIINSPVIEKFNIEESKPETIVITSDFETEDADNDFWRQHVILDEEDDLKKNS